jgi:hypothetical protein
MENSSTNSVTEPRCAAGLRIRRASERPGHELVQRATAYPVTAIVPPLTKVRFTVQCRVTTTAVLPGA